MTGWRLLERDAPHEPATTASPHLKAGVRPVLCMSGIHGDSDALESVLATVTGIELAGIVVAGNHCVGGAHPFEVWTRLNSLGAHLVAGPSDVALGALSAGLSPTPHSAADEARLATFLRTKDALGDVVCRRLGDLPSTLVVSLDDTSGVMVMFGAPTDEGRVLVDNDDLADEIGSVAEDILIVGGGAPFSRRVARPEPLLLPGDVDVHDLDVDAGVAWPERELLVANCGVVGGGTVDDGTAFADAVLLAADENGRVRAFGQRVRVSVKDARARAG